MRCFAIRCLCLCWLGLSGLTPSVALAETLPRVQIGMLAFLGDELSADAWAPMIERLQTQLPHYQFELLALDHAGLAHRAAHGELEFILTNPGHYVELEATLGASRLLTLHNLATDPARALGSTVVVRRDSPLTQLDDLRRQRVALTTREGFGGYQMLWRELAELDITPEKAFSEWLEVGFPMQGVLEAVVDGRADVGIVRTCLLEMQPELAQQLKVLAARNEPDFPCQTSTRLYPDWPLARLPTTSADLAREVAIALLSHTPAAGQPGWDVPVDYQPVHELLRELQLGPYAYLQPPTLQALAKRNWPYLALAVTVLLAWLLYTLRVEKLVQQRTHALHSALEARQQVEERMRHHQEQADHLARLSILGELAGTLAHELNQPLATINNYARSLVRRAEAGTLTDAATEQASEEIAEQSERAAAILSRIRHFARKRAPRHDAHVPAEVVNEAIALFSGLLSHAPPVELHDTLPADTLVSMDALQIQQVLLNLLKNSYDACRTLEAARQRIEVHLALSGDDLTIAVRDFGSGLAPNIQHRLFEAFFTTKPDGLGLGLSICKTIAEAHGGRLSASANTDAPGMTFTLTVPAHE